MKRKLLTAEGYKKLKDELEYLHRTLRPEITEIVVSALKSASFKPTYTASH